MEKKRKIKIISLLIVLLILAIPAFIVPKFIGYMIRVPNYVQLYFYTDDCPLDGYIFSGDQLIGKSEGGYFNLSYDNYKENLDSEKNISLFGKLENCGSGLLFDKYWEGFEIKEYYFEGQSVFKFKTTIVENNPVERELMGYIQPEKVKLELNNINLTDNVLEDLSSINNYLNSQVNYTKDWDFNKKTNHWQEPLETLQLRQGDCEDYSSTLLSLFQAYNPNLNCYNIIFSSHVTTFCFIDDNYTYYDQKKTELRKEIYGKDRYTKTNLSDLKDEYFQHYGIEDSETRAYYAFNDNVFIEFRSEKEFLNWQFDLNVKPENILTTLETQYTNLPVYNETQEIELRSEPVAATKTLKGFFQQYSITLIALGVIFCVLIFFLVIVNKKK